MRECAESAVIFNLCQYFFLHYRGSFGVKLHRNFNFTRDLPASDQSWRWDDHVEFPIGLNLNFNLKISLYQRLFTAFTVKIHLSNAVKNAI